MLFGKGFKSRYWFGLWMVWIICCMHGNVLSLQGANKGYVIIVFGL